MKIFLNILIVLLAVAACFSDFLLIYAIPPEKGASAAYTIRSRRPFIFNQEKEFVDARKFALKNHVPIYRFIPDTLKSARESAAEFRRTLSENKGNDLKNREAVKNFLESYTDRDLKLSDIRRLLQYKDMEKLIEGILTIEESILHELIVDDREKPDGKQAVEVLYSDPRGGVVYPVKNVISVSHAKKVFTEKVSHVYWQIQDDVVNPVSRFFMAGIKPNIQYDEIENNHRLNEIHKRYPKKLIQYRPGDVLLPFSKTISEEDISLLKTYYDLENNTPAAGIPWVLVFTGMVMILYQPVLSKFIAVEFRKAPPFGVLLTLLIIMMLLLTIYLLFTPFPVIGFPFCFLPFLIVLLNHENLTAFWTIITGALLASLLCGNMFIALALFIFSGFTSILAFTKRTRRINILFPSAMAGLLNVLIVITLSVYTNDASLILNFSDSGKDLLNQFLHSDLFQDIRFAFMGGLFSGPVALIILPFIELSRYNASTFKLNHYMDLQHPIMRDLLTKTPGTYQHTMTVAYLSQCVGEAVGLNTDLLRVGAYYHDIGKTAKPNLFIENQFSGKNPHHDLDPVKSTEIIHQHIANGLKIGAGAGLPQIILDLIVQHHGTLPVEFFYNEACKSGTDVSKGEFRYRGPKPQTVEAAILMITDAVEAASRTLHEPTRKDIKNLVHTIISKRISDRQFDECDLTTRNIATIIQTLIDSLEASFHSRVEYPWQTEKKEKPARNDRSGAPKTLNKKIKDSQTPETPREDR